MGFNGRSDRTIKPGATEDLAITLSCHKLTGSFTRNIIVTTNDPDHPRETLVCKGQILEPLKMMPNNVNFGNISPQASTLQKTISLTRGDGGPLNPKLAPINTPGVEASIKEIEPGKRYELVVKLTPPFKSRRLAATLQLETGSAEAPTVTIPVYATIVPPRAPREDRAMGPPRPKGPPPNSP